MKILLNYVILLSSANGLDDPYSSLTGAPPRIDKSNPALTSSFPKIVGHIDFTSLGNILGSSESYDAMERSSSLNSSSSSLRCLFSFLEFDKELTSSKFV